MDTYSVEAFIEGKMEEGKMGTLKELVAEEKEKFINKQGEITIKVETPRKACRNHNIMYFLIGEKCPYCHRKSISAYE